MLRIDLLPSLLPFFLLIVGCSGSVDKIEQVDVGPIPNRNTPQQDLGQSDSSSSNSTNNTNSSVPDKPGDPCPAGECGGETICVAALCRKKCTQPIPYCSDYTADCPDGQVCMSATSFTDACFSALAKTGEPCGDGTVCVPKNVCVKPDANSEPKCLQLCKYGCDSDCAETTNGCSVCMN